MPEKNFLKFFRFWLRCAKNEGLKQAIEKVLKVKAVELPIDPQLMGALGAAEYARQKGMAR